MLNREDGEAGDISDVDEAAESADSSLVERLAGENVPNKLDAFADLLRIGVWDQRGPGNEPARELVLVKASSDRNFRSTYTGLRAATVNDGLRSSRNFHSTLSAAVLLAR
jgi:hypothetical protein